MKKINSFTRASLALIGMLFLLSGCTGYRLGSMLPADVSTVYIPNFHNETQEPFLISEATRAVILELQRDGSLEIVGPDEADAILTVTLKDYDLRPSNYDRSDRSRPDQYKVVLTAEVVFTHARTGKVLVSKPRVTGDTYFDFAGDLTNTRRQALPEASRDLAHDVVELIVELWPR